MFESWSNLASCFIRLKELLVITIENIFQFIFKNCIIFQSKLKCPIYWSFVRNLARYYIFFHSIAFILEIYTHKMRWWRWPRLEPINYKMNKIIIRTVSGNWYLKFVQLYFFCFFCYYLDQKHTKLYNKPLD